MRRVVACRCTCKFSHDDSKLGCSILCEAKESGFDSLWLFDLATNTKTMLVKEVAIGSFVWSPDDTQLIRRHGAEAVGAARVLARRQDRRDLANNAMETHLFDLAGWTSP